MLIARIVTKTLLLGIMVLGAVTVSGQTFPTRPIRVFVGAPGSATDFVVRLVGNEITGALGQPLILENHPGAGIPQIVAKAPPDGYTLMSIGAALWIDPLQRAKPLWDPVKDFSPITLLMAGPSILVVRSSSPVKSVSELIALAKAKPGELNISSSPPGGTSSVAAVLFNQMADIKTVLVPFGGSAQQVLAVLSGQVDATFTVPGSVSSLIQQGRLRGLAVTGPRPSALGAGLPTVASSGLPGYELLSMIGLWAPAKTPTTIVKRLNQEIVRVLAEPENKQRILASGSEAVGNSPEEFAAMINADMARMRTVFKDAGNLSTTDTE